MVLPPPLFSCSVVGGVMVAKLATLPRPTMRLLFTALRVVIEADETPASDEIEAGFAT